MLVWMESRASWNCEPVPAVPVRLDPLNCPPVLRSPTVLVTFTFLVEHPINRVANEMTGASKEHTSPLRPVKQLQRVKQVAVSL